MPSLAKRRPGYANFALDEPALKLVLIENPGQGGSLSNHLGLEVPSTDAGAAATRRLSAACPPHPSRGRHHLLLRAAGQGVGERAGR